MRRDKKLEIEQRVIEEALILTKNQLTVRQVAKRYGVSKSTVHKDLTERLPGIKGELYRDVQLVLKINKAERHIRGGNATKARYDSLKR